MRSLLLLQEVGGGDLTNAVLTMLYHVKEANAIFMTKVGDGPGAILPFNLVSIQDFDNNNRSDCVGFEVSAITIIETTESYVNILLGDYKEPEASPTLSY